MDIIKKLSTLILERGLTIYRLSELSGINQSTLANTFSRGTIPSIKNLEIICETLGITLSQFFSTNETSVLMTKDEIEIYNKYKKLPKEIKETINDVIEKYAHLINNN